MRHTWTQTYALTACSTPTCAPTLIQDPAASERLVVRLLRRPSTRSVLVGDVVAFHSPLAQPDDDTHVMVRPGGRGGVWPHLLPKRGFITGRLCHGTMICPAAMLFL